MINRLRKKIFWIIQLSLTFIIVGIMIVFITFSYRNTIQSSAIFIDRIEDSNNRPGEFNNPFLVDVEGIYKLIIDDDTIIEEFEGVDDEIREYAIKVIDKKQEEGYIGNYIYRIRRVGNTIQEVVLMENEETIHRLKMTIALIVIIGIVGMIAVWIIAKRIAQTIVKPVEESFEKQKQFVSDASHELKTPLAIIEANSDVLQNKVGNNKWLTYIQDEVQSMNKLVNDLLILSKMENTNVTNIQKFDLSKEVQMSVSVFESMIYEKEIQLETNIEENIWFNGEKEDIKHIIAIILDNAIKHTEKDGKIIVNTQKEKNEINIEVKNQGEPIPEDEREKIFERFYRVDKARNRNEKRYGLRTFHCERNRRQI